MRIIVVNGERDWPEYFPVHELVSHRVQETTWVLRSGRLFAVDRAQAGIVDAVLWRVGAVRPDERQRIALEMIRLAGVPCVNSAAVLLRNFDRLGMLAALKEIGATTPAYDAVSDTELLDRVGTAFPRVLKVGGFHAGQGKAKIVRAEDWGEVRDMAYVTQTYATVEPFVPHERDVRCLLIGDAVFAMERRGLGWRANVDTIKSRLIDPPPELETLTLRLAAHLNTSIIAVDALETADGWVVMESNETPGLTGFPAHARVAMAEVLLRAVGSPAVGG